MACGRVFKLHRVVLISQSKLLDNIFSCANNTDIPGISYILDVGGGSILTLECAEEWGLDGDGLEYALKDIYKPYDSHFSNTTISHKRVFPILIAACFLNYPHLINKCIRHIVATSSAATIAEYLTHLDSTLAALPNFPETAANTAYREFHRRKTAVCDALTPALTSCFLRAVNLAASGDSGGGDDIAMMAEVPFRWFQYAVESPMLCVAGEFARYEILKRWAVARWRRTNSAAAVSAAAAVAAANLAKRKSGFLSSMFGDQSRRDGVENTLQNNSVNGRPGIGNGGTSSPTIAESLRESVMSFESSLFGGGGGSSARGGGPMGFASTSILSRLVNLYGQDYLRTAGNDVAAIENNEPMTVLGLFESAIVYTYMTFVQLERVKADRIVSDASVLNSFWMQAELINRFTTPFQSNSGNNGSSRSSSSSSTINGSLSASLSGLGAFRFAVKFSGLRDFVRNNFEAIDRGEKVVLASEAIKCAGIDYRVLISVELDEKFRKNLVGHKQQQQKDQRVKRRLFQLKKSKSMDDMKISTVSRSSVEMGVIAEQEQKEMDEFWSKYVLKATLQRNRIHGGVVGGGNGGGFSSLPSSQNAKNGGTHANQRQTNNAPPIAYTVHKFDTTNFTNGLTLLQEPVTTCGFDGTGFIKTFSLPKDVVKLQEKKEEMKFKSENIHAQETRSSSNGNSSSNMQSKIRALRESLKKRVGVERSGSYARYDNDNGLAGDIFWMAVAINLIEQNYLVLDKKG
ncbi:hypothetical protein HK100_004218 [Physocladia obscura]|uniref:BTB domain-containing protein n=1 Tax=Physocladia obscura TaxID=109957 RepID=A0AAD5T760_9FUNG|nr:hypothetical protein HK100_004218 [Physocladia obscura]